MLRVGILAAAIRASFGPTPEPNTATQWDPTRKSPSITISGGGYVAVKGGPNAAQSVLAIDGKSAGKWCLPVVFTPMVTGGGALGVAADGFNADSYVGNDAFSYDYESSDGTTYHNGTGAPYGDAWSAGDTIEVLYADGDIRFTKNGVVQNGGIPVVSGLVGVWYPAATLFSAASSDTATISSELSTYAQAEGYQLWGHYTPPPDGPSAWSQTVMLLHMDSLGGSVLANAAPRVRSGSSAFTGSVNAALDTATYKFGPGSLAKPTDDTSPLVSVGSASNAYDEYDVRWSDFTVHGWAKQTAQRSHGLFCQRQGGATGWALQTTTGGAILLRGKINGGFQEPQVISADGVIPLNVFYHWALQRRDSTYEIFIDGVKVATLTKPGVLGDETDANSPYTRIGASTSSGEATFVGNMDEVVFINGQAIYDEDFTPATAPVEPGELTVPTYDPYWKNVDALLYGSGIAGSTTISDETGRTWVTTGGVSISAESELGGGSINFDGTGYLVSENLYVPQGSNYSFEAFVTPAEIKQQVIAMVGYLGGSYAQLRLGMNAAGKFYALMNVNGSAQTWENTSSYIGSVTAVAGQRYFVQLVIRRGSLRLMIDGVIDAQYTGSDAGPYQSTAGGSFNTHLGCMDLGTELFHGQIENVRLTAYYARDWNLPPIRPTMLFPNTDAGAPAANAWSWGVHASRNDGGGYVSLQEIGILDSTGARILETAGGGATARTQANSGNAAVLAFDGLLGESSKWTSSNYTPTAAEFVHWTFPTRQTPKQITVDGPIGTQLTNGPKVMAVYAADDTYNRQYRVLYKSRAKTWDGTQLVIDL